MKRVFFAVLMIALSTIIMAQNFETSEDGLSVTYTKQTNDLPMTYRSGNTYVVGNQVMNRYQYGAYLCQNCPQAYAKFNLGMNLSHAGWGLFAGGCALNTTAFIMGMCHPVKDAVLPYLHAMNALYWTGDILLTASIPVLIVGYCKQHNAANMYNSLRNSQQYVSLNMGSNGLGIAYHF